MVSISVGILMMVGSVTWLGCGNGAAGAREPEQPTYCYVGRTPDGHQHVWFRVTTGIEYDDGSADTIDWNVVCRTDRCDGNALNLGQVNEGASAAMSLHDARISRVEGLEAEVRWRESVFTIDARAGVVLYRGSLMTGGSVGIGKARCEKHGELETGTTLEEVGHET